MPSEAGASQEFLALREVRVAEVPFASLLLAHHAAHTTGTLRARRGPVDKRVLLEQGVPVDCRSNLVHETLSRYLVSLGRLTEEAGNEAVAEAAGRGVRLGEILIERGVVEASELTRLLQQNLAKKLLDLFTWADGEVTVEAAPHHADSALKVKVPQLVLTGVTRFMPQASIDRAIARDAGGRFARHPAPGGIAAELKLGERERALLDALERPQRIEELLAATGVETEELVRSLYALLLLQLATPAGLTTALAPGAATTAVAPAAAASTPAPPAVAAPVDPPPAPPPPVARPAPPPSLSAAHAIESPRAAAAPSRAAPVAAPAPAVPATDHSALLNRVSQLFLDHRQKDAFDLLGVREEAPEPEIEARYLDFARELAPWRFEEPGLRLVADYARELFVAGARAYAELADRGRRSELVTRRRVAREAREREKRAAYHRIDTDLLDPALQFKKGMALLEAGKTQAALQQLEFAADCDPQNGRYRAEVAHCRFLLSPTTGGKQALEELKEAERVDPHAVELFLYHGEIAAELGRFEEAEGAYRQAAKLLGPADRRALDALRDLATKRKKRR
jgi:hypothetical protein